MKIIAVTNCEEKLKERFGYYKLVNSWGYFHPDIPIYNWEEKETDRIKKEWPGLVLASVMPVVMLEAKKRYGADLIIKLDADSIILDKLTEIIDCKDDTQVFGVRNDADNIGERDERQNRPQELWSLSNHKYVNCGCIATTSERFLQDWLQLNLLIAKRYGGVKAFWMCEQNTYNIVFHSGRYKTKILDPIGGDLFYGASANTYTDGKMEYFQTSDTPEHIIKEWGKNAWQSWKQIEYHENDGGFYLYGKKVKIVHHCGGGSVDGAHKLTFDMFNETARNKLKEITKLEY